jgi:hypothetical protein
MTARSSSLFASVYSWNKKNVEFYLFRIRGANSKLINVQPSWSCSHVHFISYIRSLRINYLMHEGSRNEFYKLYSCPSEYLLHPEDQNVDTKFSWNYLKIVNNLPEKSALLECWIWWWEHKTPIQNVMESLECRLRDMFTEDRPELSFTDLSFCALISFTLKLKASAELSVYVQENKYE